MPLASDIDKTISKDYGVYIDSGDNKGVSLRGTFIIDGNNVIRHSSINDLPVGRNVDEVLRLVKAYQHVDKFGEVCPAKWKPGDKTVIKFIILVDY
jgi:alkyl hydroperoxide reductase subunit AhpC